LPRLCSGQIDRAQTWLIRIPLLRYRFVIAQCTSPTLMRPKPSFVASTVWTVGDSRRQFPVRASRALSHCSIPN